MRKYKEIYLSLVVTVLIAFCSTVGNAQIQALSSTSSVDQQNSIEFNEKKYALKIKDEGTFTVKVVNPKGEIQSMPIKSQVSQSNLTFSLKIDKYWEDGKYIIIAENKEGILHTQKLRIKKGKVVE